MNPAQQLAVAVVWTYRALVKPFLPAACRFEPSCSSYALEAIHVHGAIRGSRLALGRLLRCRPWGGGGLDPVPRVATTLCASAGPAPCTPADLPRLGRSGLSVDASGGNASASNASGERAAGGQSPPT